MRDPLFIPMQLAYLVAASLFIIGLRDLGSPATARRGNLVAAIAMLIAIAATLLDKQVLNYGVILSGILVGSLFGVIAARFVKMTAMPQLVGLLNGFGGAASALLAIGEFWKLMESGINPSTVGIVAILLSIFVGAVTFSGSMVAYAKLEQLISGSPLTFPLQQPLNLFLLIGTLAWSGFAISDPSSPVPFLGIAGISLLLGILFVIPIGGADMPVVISLLNSLSGVAASMAGFVVMNNILIIAGALVGASGLILSQIMCKAMNRSLAHVLFGAFGTDVAGEGVASAGDKGVRSIDVEEASVILAYAKSVIFVPGYGMAVAQAQHAVRELADELQRRGVEVKYAIHPVAGRMPGHMNVLLAEADVPYTQLYDMDQINPEFERTDVAVVIGANDVVNPAARDQKGSPIYGMPILDVDKAKHCIVIKRSLNTGFAGIDNELFYREKTMMLFGGAKDVVAQVTAAVKQL